MVKIFVLYCIVDGYVGRGRPKKGWIDCLKKDMNSRGTNAEMTAEESGRKTQVVLTPWDKVT